MNDLLPLEKRAVTSIVAAKIKNPDQGARIARAIDAFFDDQDVRTFTMEDRALNAAVTGRFSAILKAMNVVSVLALGVVLLILVNTMVMNARERTRELATLRAIGFSNAKLGVLVTAQAGLLGFGGGCAALLLSVPIVERWVSRFAEETMSLPPLRIHSIEAAGTLCIGTLIGVGAAYLSVRRTLTLNVVDALRID